PSQGLGHMATLAVTFGSLLLVWAWEFLAPRWRRLEFPALHRRLGNLGIWLFNIIAAALIFPSPEAYQLQLWPRGLFGAVTAFLLLDLTSWCVHRLQHAIPLAWRFHAVHHSEIDLDWTTSVRHHPIEFLISSGVFWLAVVAGIPIEVAALHGTATHCLVVRI